MKNFKITRYNFKNDKLAKPLRIVMIADLHNQSYGEKNQRLLAAIAHEKPDVICLPGDMVVCRPEERMRNLDTADCVRRMAKIAPVYYEPGNHERGLQEQIRHTDGDWKLYSEKLRSCADIHMLNNSAAELFPWNVRIIGLDLSLVYYRRLIAKKLSAEELHRMIKIPDSDCCNILLAHNPDYFRAYCKLKPDFILSGHNHGGMIRLPLLGGLVSPRLHPFPRYDYGVYTSRDAKTHMIVTSGMGQHSVYMRVNNPPEMVVIELTGADGSISDSRTKTRNIVNSL